MAETIADYQPTIPLTTAAIIAALIGGLLASLALEILLLITGMLFKRRRRTEAAA